MPSQYNSTILYTDCTHESRQDDGHNSAIGRRGSGILYITTFVDCKGMIHHVYVAVTSMV